MSHARVWKRVWKREGDGSSDGFLARGWGKNHTPSITEKFRPHIISAFYIRYSYAYIIVNVKTELKMVYYKQQRGSSWMNTFAAAESWVNEQKSK